MEIFVKKYRIEPEIIFCGTEGSYGIETMEFVFSEEWEHLAKTVTFYPPRRAPVAVVISDNFINIPWEVTDQTAQVRFVIEGYADGVNLRTIPSTLSVVSTKKAQGVTGTTPTATEYQQIYDLMEDTLEAVENVGIKTVLVSALPEEGETDTIYCIDTGGDSPDRYRKYIWFNGAWENFGTIGLTGNGISSVFRSNTSGLVDTYTISFTNGSYTTFEVTNGAEGPTGQTGATGNGITGISKTGSSGLVDTYTIYYTNGTTSSFAVTNGQNGANGQNGQDGQDGVSITGVEKTSTSGLVDTYTISYSDGDSSTFDVTNGANGADGTDGADGADGVSITGVAKTGTAGLVDTYTISYSNGNSSTFTVTNGQDGTDGDPGIYMCTFGTTTYADIDAALAAGRLPIVGYQGVYVPYQFTDTDLTDYHYQRFGAWLDEVYIQIGCCNNTSWGTNGWDLLGTPIQITATVDSSSTGSEIPTALAVYNALPAAQVNADWNASGTVAEILNKPTIPAAQVNSDWNAASGVAQILNKPAIPDAQVNADWNASGTVAEILNKPTIPTKTSDLANDGSDGNAAYLETDETAHNAAGILYGKVDSTSTSTVFTATVPGATAYYDGLTVMLKNGVVTSAAGFTININGLGAKPVYSNMAAATADTTIFNVNYTMMFVYDSSRVSGGCWICYRGYNSDTNTIGYQLRTNNTVMKASDRSRYYKIFFTSADGTKLVPASSDWTNNATSARAVNQRPIDPFGRIAYTSATTNYTADSNIAAASLWQQYNLTLGYSFNRTGAALTLTTYHPVYVKCAPQSDGSAIMDSTTPIVQALPTTDDGKIYIFLGIATSATQVELFTTHPVYYYMGGRIRLWTGKRDPDGVNVFTGSNTIDEVYASFITGVPTYVFMNSKMFLVNDVSYMTGIYADRFQISALSSSFGGVSYIDLHAIIDKEIPAGTLCSSLSTLTKMIS